MVQNEVSSLLKRCFHLLETFLRALRGFRGRFDEPEEREKGAKIVSGVFGRSRARSFPIEGEVISIFRGLTYGLWPEKCYGLWGMGGLWVMGPIFLCTNSVE